MAFEYLLDGPCAVKEKITTPQLFGLIKVRNQTDAMISMIREQGDLRPLSEITITRQVVTPQSGNISSQTVSLQDLLNEVQPLKKCEAVCQNCQFNISKNAYGCYGAVAYPIQKRTEEWLMSLLPDDIATTAGLFLRKAVQDFKYDGAITNQVRRGGGVFESTNPIKRKWGSFFFRLDFYIGSTFPDYAL